MWLSDLSIKRPVFITMVILALVVLGGVSYAQMGVDLLPDISLPVVAVQTVYPGASPTEVEASVSMPIEESLGSLSGVDSVSSSSSEGMSLVIVQYNLEYPAAKAVEDVRTKVSAVRGGLPQNIMDPVILPFDPSSSPILSFAVVEKDGSLGLAKLRNLVDDEIKPRIQHLDGVAEAAVTGGLEREIQVQLSLDRLRALGVSPQQVVAAIKAENLDIPGGRLTEGGTEQLLRTPGKFQSVEDIAQVVLADQGKVQISDVATVSDGFKEVRSYNRLDGKDNVFISVRKQSGTNTVKVASQVHQEIEQILKEYPNLDIVVASDQSDFVKRSTQDSLVDLGLGALLAALVVFLFFRNLRNTLITVIGLPVIVVAAFWGMSLFGFTLNMITLLALSLCIGLLIDDAIVVRENIFRHMEAGEKPRVAASKATREIALAVLAMTLSIVAVFLPVAFATGIAGKMFREFGITVALAVLISLFEAFTLAPMLSAYFARRLEKEKSTTTRWGRLSDKIGGSFDSLVRSYRGFLDWALSHKALTLAVAAALFLLSLGALPLLGQTFFPEMDTGWFVMGLKLPPGTALGQTDQTVREVEGMLLQQPEVEHVFATVGTNTGPEEATLSVNMKGNGHIEEMQQRLRDRYGAIGTLSFSSGGMGEGGPSSSRPIQVGLRTSGSQDDLYEASRQVMEAIKDVPGLVDLARSVEPGKPELSIQVDRKRAADRGLSTAQIGSTVRTLVNGETASQLYQGGKDVDITVRVREADRQRYEDLFSLTIPSPSGTQVRLRDLATISPSTGPSVIERQDRERQIIVGAGYVGRPQSKVTADVTARLKNLNLPPGVSVEFTGSTQMASDSFSTLFLALGLSVIFMYMVLASQFGSFLQPVVVMLALPMAAIGALLALLATRNTLDITAMIGIILLTGIVTKNAILLVDFANQQRERGVSLKEAILSAGTIRLRPVLMTTLALIFGMLPLAVGLGAGGEWRSPMAITVIGGLITSTLLTLVVVPVAYTILEGIKRRPVLPKDDSDEEAV
ncbi:MAG TPA: efflux RND transporter permease subunit [Dehalococcoidales bacterium]|nr:efflux RND transporter permease subunit [Dehalococcoidales bacterium]